MPIVTTVLAKGYDVLLCDENVDEFCMMALGTYSSEKIVTFDDEGNQEEPKQFAIKNVGGEDLGLTTEEEKKEAEEATEANASLFDAMKEALGDKVEKVIVSTRLTDAPVVLTTEGAVSLQMAQIFKQQPGGDEETPDVHIIMEVNAKHPVFETLKKAQEAGEADKVKKYTGILYDQALLVEGLPIDNPLEFSQAITSLMQ